MAISKYYKQGNDVFSVDEAGTSAAVGPDQFKELGINYNLLGEGAGSAAGIDNVRDAETKAMLAGIGQTGDYGQYHGQDALGLQNDGAVTTGETPEEKASRLARDARQQKILALQDQWLSGMNPSDRELQLRGQVNNGKAALERGVTQEYGRDQAMSLATGREALLRRQAAIEMQPLVDELKLLQDDRNSIPQKLAILKELQNATLPEVLKTEIDPDTGEVTAVKRDPMTGRVTSEIVGHVTPKAAKTTYVSTSQEIAADGSKIFTGITADGKVIRQTIAPAGTFRAPGTTTQKTNVLTISEAHSLGLPMELVGRSEDQLVADLQSTRPPSWFRNKATADAQQAAASQNMSVNITDQQVISLWQNYRTKVIGDFSKSTSSSGDRLQAIVDALGGE